MLSMILKVKSSQWIAIRLNLGMNYDFVTKIA